MKGYISKSKNTKKNTIKNVIRTNLSAWILLVPSLFLFIVISWKPIVTGAFLSFFEMKGFEPQGFVGLANYIEVISDSEFFTALWNTVQYVLWSIVIGFWPSILFAIMLNEMVHAKSFLKFSLYLPSMIPSIAVAMIWYFLFQPGSNGMLNILFSKIGLAESQWLQNSALTIPLIVFTMTWKNFGATTIMYLASLQMVNTELYEAATIDGAGVFAKVKNITLPQISGTVLLFFVNQMIGIFQLMTEPMVMTDGGPGNASITLNLQSYYYAFRYLQPGKSLAMGVITFVLLIFVTVFYFKLQKRVNEN